MKKILMAFLMCGAIITAHAQTFPVQNLTVAGTAVFSGTTTAPTPAVGTNNTEVVTTAAMVTHSPCPSIMDFGGNNTNSADNTAAFAATAAAGPAGQACVYFPPGVFQFANQFTYALSTPTASISVRGAGQGVSILTWPTASSGGMQITYGSPGNGVHIQDLSFTTGRASGGTAIQLIQGTSLFEFAQTDIHNVTIQGADNNGTTGSDYWAYGINIEGVCGTSLDSVTIYGAGAGGSASGNGLIYQGNGTGYSIYHNISKSTFNNLQTGIIYGSYAQGMTVTQSNFQNDNNGIVSPPGATGILSQLQVSDSQFATTSNNIITQTNIGNVIIHDNDMFCHTNASCIYLQENQSFSIIGNNIATDGSSITNTAGITIGPPLTPYQVGTITGNVILGLDIGIVLQSGSTGNNVQSNAYSGNTTNVDNLGSGNTIGGGSE